MAVLPVGSVRLFSPYSRKTDHYVLPELITLLEKRELALAEHYNKVQYFSAFLSNAVKYGRVIQQKMKGVRGYYYLLPHWLDEQNNIKTEYYEKML